MSIRCKFANVQMLLNPSQIDEIFKRFEKNNPDPKIELNYQNHYTLLVAVILSAQSTDKMVNKVTPELFQVANTPELMCDLGEEGLRQYIKRIGLYNSKARHIIAMSEMLIARFHSQVPGNFKDLIALPGVGIKSANVILNTLFAEPRVAVDTHVFRVSNRIGLCHTKTPEETTKILSIKIPKAWLKNAHHWLVLHGRYTCVARNPKCGACIISNLCVYRSAAYS